MVLLVISKWWWQIGSWIRKSEAQSLGQDHCFGHRKEVLISAKGSESSLQVCVTQMSSRQCMGFLWYCVFHAPQSIKHRILFCQARLGDESVLNPLEQLHAGSST